MDEIELYDHERTALREELHNLKSCQITFLTSSVTATGVLLGLATTLASSLDLGVIFLFPLIVLFPSWWIFFDKATTITRIVGYYRILERLILQHCRATNFVGWENALGEFRKRQTCRELNAPKNEQDNSRLARWIEIFSLHTSHRYWVISYFTFFALSGLCVLVSITSLKTAWLFVIPVPALLFLVSVLWNARIVWQLIYGNHSYDCNEHFWKQILGVT